MPREFRMGHDKCDGSNEASGRNYCPVEGDNENNKSNYPHDHGPPLRTKTDLDNKSQLAAGTRVHTGNIVWDSHIPSQQERLASRKSSRIPPSGLTKLRS
ncbi:hypothetical protein SARC_07767 [Sphaeroforma arctica JP610]|uniref:Uncharacterized protein n=1 Tax=Sphaeroforma arctica JP610 TaxID=667725 RepID=A0A0L0FSU8_9EUKA|nr:hypothetical protein SARC_07767 [Sphaeroforma arctica JP610]KNC79860.1 hypothetical protein SARC_07767 [Sphaeroforma arctica JP610]|eukprot:XP_014153762.1 hypothetical protein SARC_07767 [Sphaeroforma arctica JP610]